MAFGEIPAVRNAPMKDYTTFAVGGPVDVLLLPRNEAELLEALRMVGERGEPWFVVGNGSNLLVRDGGIRGCVISTKNVQQIAARERGLFAEAGAMLPRIASRALALGLSGLEFASGIPGTLGGAIRMNAGAYDGQMAEVVAFARIYRAGCVLTLSKDDLKFAYRSSALLPGDVVLSAELSLIPAEVNDISRKMEDFNARRREKQPLNFPSAGSTFKRPPGHFAGGLIETAGLKGESVGGAQVSEKHAGFIVNTGGATAKDVIMLIEKVQRSVFETTGVRLETEVCVIGED